MKKTITMVLIAALVLSIAALAGCGNAGGTVYAINDYTTVRYDEKTVAAEGNVFTALDGSWNCRINVNETGGSSIDRLLFKAIELGGQKERFQDRVLGEKQLGGTTFTTATFIENEKFGGRYIVQFSPDAPVKGKDVTVNNVCAVFFAESDASLPAIEQLISTLQVDLAG